MNRFFRSLLLLSAISCLAVNCRKKIWDDYYGRPESLEPPIYQVLQSKANFKTLLACIDKAGYTKTLNSAGYWTLFAPTDSAFAVYLQQSGIGSVDKMTEATAQQIVRFCLVYNAFNTDRLDDYQSNAGWVADNAFRRRTAYYDLFDTVVLNGTSMVTVASNRNAGYSSADNNNKYITYFTDAYFKAKGITDADYKYFYPNSVYRGLNVMDAAITQTNIPAENGVIHVVDKVLQSQPSIEQHLEAQGRYSVFRGLLERYTTSYVESLEATDRYNVLYGGNSKVSIKFYTPLLGFSPNNENYLKAQDNDGQSNCWTMFAPENDVLVPYLKNVVLEHYNRDTANLNRVPINVLLDLLNSYMYQMPVWPTQFAKSGNFLGEEPRFNSASDIIEKRVLSNGFFYGTKKAQETNNFSTVFGRPYLDPSYSLMSRLLEGELKQLITNPKIKYDLFMMSDAAIRNLGFDWDSKSNAWVATRTGMLGAGDPKGTLMRIINHCVVPRRSRPFNPLSGQGIVEGNGGEMFRYDNGKVYAAGNIDSSRPVTITQTVPMNNGNVYYTDGLLYFSAKPVGKRLEELAASPSSPYYSFFQYLKNSTLYNAGTSAISGVALGFIGSFLIPDNAAIAAAVSDKLLPAVVNPTDAADKEKVARFIQYHIIKKSVIANGTQDASSAETLYRSLQTDRVGYVVIHDPANDASLSFTDDRERNISIDPANSYVLADRIIIHSLKGYLYYQN
ncbi:putative surface protein with fasciclin (FAS1) repeats [Filimonas zeae]|uniref:fasciclin domain-containing protein n=1 Tax=Filimonas zeae TaxID=1737353 RepID=UPI001663D3A9|nr:fasciclin domain-containing protein [Filimonas zeae]MDR6337212.1 putative surface protein with fasciclin (FAS1) repeats [Filimonas zeae]